MALLAFACARDTSRELDKSAFVGWFSDNEQASLHKKIGTVDYSLTYVPADYMIATNHRNELETMRSSERDSMRAEYNAYNYFIYQITIDNFNQELARYELASPEAYQERIDYYTFRMQEDLKALVDGDTLPCVVYHFERNFGISPENRFLIGFPKSEAEKECSILIENKYLKSGPVKFTVTPEYVKNTPLLKLNS